MPAQQQALIVSGYTMTSYKLLVSLLILTLSCNNHKTKKVVTSDAIKNFVDTNKQVAIDSNYLNTVKEIKENPYSNYYDTIIKGGFSISYYHDTENQYLIYKKGKKVIDTIGGGSLGLLYKNLGYIGADFDKTFVFVSSFGSANPNYIWLFDKETARNLIPEGSAWIDVDTLTQVLLYSKSDVPFEKDGDSMTLFDTKKMTQKEFAFPKEIFDEPEKLNRIKLVTVTDKSFTIKYTYKDWTITKKRTYSR